MGALFVIALGPGCGGHDPDGGGPRDAGLPDADDTSTTPDARVTPDAGPPPFFDYPTKLTASSRSSHDWFGWSVAAADDVLVVGVPFYSMIDEAGDVVRPATGAAFVFERSGGGWAERARLLLPKDETSAMFGYAVATSGDIIAVGAWNHSGNNQRGAVFVFERQNGSWVNTARLDPLSGDDQTRFGFSLSMSGNRIAVGAPVVNTQSSLSTPAYVFEKGTGGAWVGARLVASDRSPGGLFGYSIALSGDTVVVGAPHDSARVNNAGAAYVFERSGSNWVQVDKLIDPDGEPMDSFGRSVAIDLDTIAVGAEFGGAPSILDTGAVHVFERQSGSWTEAAHLLASDSAVDDRLGAAMAVHGDLIIAGAHNRDDMGAQSGAAYVFRRGSAGWEEISKLIVLDGSPGDNLGAAVAVVGGMVLVGSRYDDDGGMDSGSAYVFEMLPDL